MRTRHDCEGLVLIVSIFAGIPCLVFSATEHDLTLKGHQKVEAVPEFEWGPAGHRNARPGAPEKLRPPSGKYLGAFFVAPFVSAKTTLARLL
jgi:hypothetical protein